MAQRDNAKYINVENSSEKRTMNRLFQVQRMAASFCARYLVAWSRRHYYKNRPTAVVLRQFFKLDEIVQSEKVT